MVLAGLNFWGSIMSVCKSILLVVTLLVTALPAVAFEGVAVTEADGYITRWVTRRATPTPGYCDWRVETPPVQSFFATNGDGAGNIPCDDPWYVKCDNDSLVYQGAWPAHSAATIEGTNYESVLTCTVSITAEVGMFCTRSAVGNLDVDDHRLTLEHPGGEVVTIFPTGPGPDDVQLVLAPGNLHRHHDDFRQHDTSVRGHLRALQRSCFGGLGGSRGCGGRTDELEFPQGDFPLIKTGPPGGPCA